MQNSIAPAQFSTGRRGAALGILLVGGLYVVYALATHLEDYGLIAKPEANLKWTIIRLSSVSIWLLVAALLLRYSVRPVNWRSFSYSFVAAGIAAIVVAPSLASGIANHRAIAGAIVFYALVSGLLCVTVRKPAVAAGLGVLFFTAQLLVDATAHVLMGGFRLH